MDSAEREAQTERLPLLNGRLVVYITMFGLVGGALWTYRKAFYQGLQYPYNTFMYRPEVAFTDLTNFYTPLLDGKPLSSELAVYPPFSYVLMLPFAHIGGIPSVIVLAAVTCVGLAIFSAFELRGFPMVDRAALVATLAVFNYPVLFALDRSNVDVLAALFVAGAIVAIQLKKPILGSVLIGAAAAIKIYPAILFVMLIRKRQWKALAAGILAAVVLSLASFAVFSYSPTEGIRLLSEHLSTFTTKYAVGDMGLQYGSSLFGLLKVLLVPSVIPDLPGVESMLTVYTAASVVVGLAVVAAALWLPLKLWEQVTLLTAAALLLPSVSSDYRLVTVVIPLALFLRAKETSRLSPLVAICFALLLVPKPYDLVRAPDVFIGVIVNPLLLVALMAIVVGAGLARKRNRQPARKPAEALAT